MADQTPPDRTPPMDGSHHQVLEVWPGVPSSYPAATYELVASGQVIGTLYRTSDLTQAPAWVDKGWQPEAQYWVWSAGQEKWPQGTSPITFVAQLDEYLDAASPPEVPTALARSEGTLVKDTAPHTLYATHNPTYAITFQIGGEIQGYLQVATQTNSHQNINSLKVFAMVETSQGYLAPDVGTPMYFTQQTGDIKVDPVAFYRDRVI